VGYRPPQKTLDVVLSTTATHHRIRIFASQNSYSVHQTVGSSPTVFLQKRQFIDEKPTALSQNAMPPYSPLDDMGSFTTVAYEREESTEFAATAKINNTVSFNRDVLVYDHIYLNDFSDEEFDSAWHTAEELATIRAEIVETVRLMLSGSSPPDDDSVYCSRGLEYRTPTGSHLRRAHKCAVWDAVADEQSRQWSQGIVDDESIAGVYHACVELCCDSAIRLAQEDAVFVQHEMEDDGLCWQNDSWLAKTRKFMRGRSPTRKVV
jgi:hypothetical protein